jgi:hypothetical protein
MQKPQIGFREIALGRFIDVAFFAIFTGETQRRRSAADTERGPD